MKELHRALAISDNLSRIPVNKNADLCKTAHNRTQGFSFGYGEEFYSQKQCYEEMIYIYH